jgi:hypothetical protein
MSRRNDFVDIATDDFCKPDSGTAKKKITHTDDCRFQIVVDVDLCNNGWPSIAEVKMVGEVCP